jgi:hypothetical protein
MCIFSQEVGHVGSTRIFIADLGHGVHATAYQMAFLAPEPVAMILPVPVLKGTGEEALTFVDLGGYDGFFDDLARCFPRPRGIGGGYGMADTPQVSLLAVHEVGDYVASYVPSVADFHRLDPRFRLPEAAWETLPDYHDFGFAVFQLRPGKGMQRVHPIAYRYPAGVPEELFFPTVHVHDGGRADATASFDHDLYFQHSGRPPDRDLTWKVGTLLPGQVMDIGRGQGLVAPDLPLVHATIRNTYGDKHPNADIVILRGEGRTEVEARPVRDGSGVGPRMGWSEFLARRKSRSGGRY